MPGYISEFDYFGNSTAEFVEIAVPTGTDVTGYSLVLYEGSGFELQTFSLGTSVDTIAGHDVYLIDASTPGFSTPDPTGAFYPDDAIALVDDGGTVLQFLSWDGNAIPAFDGPAAGQTSTSVGSALTDGHSLQSDDGGASYFLQTASNPGSIPACYAAGTRIDTADGKKAIEDLTVGDTLERVDGEPIKVLRLVYQRRPVLPSVPASRPVLIQKDALGPGRPNGPLVVSGQHRIAVGMPQQAEQLSGTWAFVPACALVDLPGIRWMNGRSQVAWYHVVCECHALIWANGLVSETMFLGDQAWRTLGKKDTRAITRALGPNRLASQDQALPFMRPGQVRKRLKSTFSGNSPQF